MKVSIDYVADLNWRKLVEISEDDMRRIIDDINSFNPIVPIQESECEMKFSVQYDGGHSYIQFSTSVNRAKLYGEEGHTEDDDSFLDHTIIARLKDIVFAMNIAYPGYIFIYKSVLLRDGEPACVFSYSNDISGMVYSKCDWINFERLTISQCWDWIVSKTSFLAYISRSPIDRALHALSYESCANEDIFVFYVLVGIEAIYNNGSDRVDSILAQLRRKSQAIIGELPKKAMSAMSEMYGKRSKLVHGSANIYKCWESEDCTEEEYEIADKEREYMITATGILLATIQKFVKANANSLVETVSVRLE